MPIRFSRREVLPLLATGLAAPAFGWLRVAGAAAPRTDRVVVLGAGIAGLAAARTLVQRYGFRAPGQVIVLEARNRLGGRIDTETALGPPVEMGATWIHGVRGNPIAALAAELGIVTEPTNYENVRLYDHAGALVAPATYNHLYDDVFVPGLAAAVRYGTHQDTDPSLQASFDAVRVGQGLSAADARVLDFHEWWNIEADVTLRLDQLSTYWWDADLAFSGNDALFPGGYRQVVDGVAAGLDVRTDQVVEAVDWSGPTITVQTNHGVFACERLVVTLPLGVLKAGSVAFAPALPSAIQGPVERLGFGKVHKIVLRFPTPFWDTSADFLLSIGPGRIENVELLNVARYRSEAVLSCWTVAEFAAALENLSPAAATAQMMTRLRTIFGNAIPDPIGVARSGWIDSPYTGGAYTYWAPGSSPADQRALQRDVGGRLFFAGEHTSRKYPQTVHGAWLSGLAAAKGVRRRAA